ncbi:MAG: YidE/YbjL duplication [Thermoanaerobacteraceae bacterium]|nr:YidE/YbjL duplication [Thermoanaerobacteraceae bacterium]
MEWLSSVFKNQFMVLFLVTALGLLVGRIKIGTFSLETSGCLFVGLVFGYYGFKVTHDLFTFSLIIFVTTVGLLAAKDIGYVVKKYGLQFVFLGLFITFIGAVATYIFTTMYGQSIDPYLVSGVYTGAYTSSPGLAAAVEATNNNPNITIGHAVAYPIGVLIVILFVDFAPAIFGINVKKERETYTAERAKEVAQNAGGQEKFSWVAFALSIVVGIIIGNIPIPVPGVGTIKLESTGGVLISSLLLGYIGKVGPIDFRMPKNILANLREMGLAFFLTIVGLEGGAGFVGVVQKYGIILLVISFIAGIVGMVGGFLVGRYVFHINWVLLAGAICGGMTSTPGLGAAVEAVGTDEVAAGYGAAYPFALFGMVLFTILLHRFLGM